MTPEARARLAAEWMDDATTPDDALIAGAQALVALAQAATADAKEATT